MAVAQPHCAALTGSSCVPGCGGNAGSFCCKNGALALSTPAAGFAPILSRVAEIVKPPSALLLPTQPADAAVTMLRITRGDGTTRTICTGPADPSLNERGRLLTEARRWLP